TRMHPRTVIPTPDRVVPHVPVNLEIALHYVAQNRANVGLWFHLEVDALPGFRLRPRRRGWVVLGEAEDGPCPGAGRWLVGVRKGVLVGRSRGDGERRPL